MENKIGSFFARLLFALITGYLLMKSIEWFMSDLVTQKKNLQTQTLSLENEINAPSYFQSQGIKLLTPEIVLNYDKKFGTNLYKKINFKSDQITYPSHYPKISKEPITYGSTVEVSHQPLITMQPFNFYAYSNLKTSAIGTHEISSLATIHMPISQKANNEQFANLVSIQETPLTAVEITSQESEKDLKKLETEDWSLITSSLTFSAIIIKESNEQSTNSVSAPLAELKITSQESQKDLKKLETGDWNMITSSLTFPAIIIWVLGVFFTNLINKMSEDFYPTIKQLVSVLIFTPCKWMFNKILLIIRSSNNKK
jgi:hypothetical protein